MRYKIFNVYLSLGPKDKKELLQQHIGGHLQKLPGHNGLWWNQHTSMTS